MNLKSVISEAKNYGEKVKNDVLTELFKSKKVQELVSNKHFIQALTRVIQTKDEVKKAINVQINHIFEVMEVPSKQDLLKLAGKLGNLEKLIETVGRNRIAIKILPKLQNVGKASPAKHTTTSHPRAAAAKSTVKRSVAKKAPAKRKAPAKKAV